MNEKKDCKIVQDLLPNYIENLTSEETNLFIKEHLKECTECQNILENMQKELNIDNMKREEREVKYIKKFSNKMKILKLIILTLIIIYVVIVIGRSFIMTSLSKKAKENLLNNNYYAKLYSYQGDSLTITESYNKGEDYLTTKTSYVNGNQIQKLTYYKKGTEELFLTDLDGKKYIQNPESMVGSHVVPEIYVSCGLLTNMQEAFITGIDKTYCNTKECYVFEGNDYERYVDKETGLIVRAIEKSNKDLFSSQIDMIIDYEYKFNVVQDSDIVRPDTTGYIFNE